MSLATAIWHPYNMWRYSEDTLEGDSLSISLQDRGLNEKPKIVKIRKALYIKNQAPDEYVKDARCCSVASVPQIFKQMQN